MELLDAEILCVYLLLTGGREVCLMWQRTKSEDHVDKVIMCATNSQSLSGFLEKSQKRSENMKNFSLLRKEILMLRSGALQQPD